MQKRRRQIAAWWESLDTEMDNHRVNPNIFKSCDPFETSQCDPSDELNPENCYIIREAFQKLQQFLNSSHQEGCSDKACKYDPRTCSLKITIKKSLLKDKQNPAEFKLRKKRGRKSKFELQQMALMQAARGTISL